MKEKLLKIPAISLITIIAAIILLVSSSLKHALFQSTAWDLGIFDQAIYLISQGKTPISSFLDSHILGDHGALIFYPLALFYRVYPDVHWLFIIQAIALAIGVLPLVKLAQQSGLKSTQITAISLTYLLYPLIFNVNLFDFHTDVIALPTILWAVLAARNQHLFNFCLAILIILSCKAVFSLTVIGIGVWLFLWEKRRLYGIIALSSGIAWYLIGTQVIIPIFSNGTATVGRHLSRYNHLGTSFTEISQNLIFKPWLFLKAIFNGANLGYLALLILPLIWGLHWQYLTPLIAAIPSLAMNLLSNVPEQKDLLHQYSLTIVPFLFLSVISALAAGKTWLKNPRYIILWSLITFLALAKFSYFGGKYLESLDNLTATKDATNHINSQGNLLTSAEIAPHLTHRSIVKLAITGTESIDLNQFDYILLNKRHPGWQSSPELVDNLVSKIGQMPEFTLEYGKDDVFLFKKSLKQ